ncbi:MAG: hypothetical protein M3Y42_14165 [Actinomycetota bacterium]|nr:hypothetical protein [Actinomycetota bacterium]MDQ2958096.1 hypothetical protein [Actinomycetota bacterium]
MADAVEIYVDLQALQELANKLAQIKDALSNAKDDLQSYGPALGSGKVNDSLNDFVNGWKDGRKKIDGNIDKLVEKVKGAAQTFADQENTLAKASQGGH